MKLTRQYLDINLSVYRQAKERLTLISEWEEGKVTENSMRQIGLEDFARFSLFLSNCDKLGINLDVCPNFKDLKSVLVSASKGRWKTWISNRSERQFKELFKDISKFDRFLNGRWISKPTYRRRGKRSNDRWEALWTYLPLVLNWLIGSEVEIIESADLKLSDILNSGNKTSEVNSGSRWDYYYIYHWYLPFKEPNTLDLGVIRWDEIELTKKLLVNLVDNLCNSGVNFRKLNYTFIIDNFSKEVSRLMLPVKGTALKANKDLKTSFGVNRLTEGNTYYVEDSNLSVGVIRVLVLDDSGWKNYYDISDFDDLTMHRDSLLKQLGI
jgi:hypothetical protein